MLPVLSRRRMLSTLWVTLGCASSIFLASLPELAAQSSLPETSSPVVSWGEGVRLGAWIQPVFMAEGRDWEADRQGFMLRRARLDFSGALVEGGIHFRLMPDLAQNPELRDAWVEIRNPWGNLRMGQQTIPFDLQREWSMAYAHFGERALAARMFELSGGRDLGATWALRPMDGRLRIDAGVFNGMGPNRRELGRRPLLAGRTTWALGGNSPGRESGRARPEHPILTLGAGAMAANQSALRPRPGFSADRIVDWRSGTLDTHLVWHGATFLAAAYRQEITRDGGTSEAGDGFFVSAGWALSAFPLEVVARFGETIWDSERDAGAHDEFALGLTFFHEGHGSQFRIQFARERLQAGTATQQTLRRLTLEHQLLLGG